MASETSRLADLTPPTSSGRIAMGITLALLVVACGGFTAMCAGLEVSANLIIQPVVAVFAMVFAAAFALPYLLIILWLDRNEREPWYLIVSALVWGAVLATGLSGIFNTMFGGVAFLITGDEAMAMQLSASISAPLVEEITKGAALIALYFFFRHEFDNVLDGVVYGALIGLGFAVFENFSYYVNQPQGVAGVFLLTFVRGIISAAGGSHATFTALTGLGIGLFRTMRRGWARWLLPPAGLAAAMFMHFSWNTFTGMIMGVAPGGDVGGLLIGLPAAVVIIQFPFLIFVLGTAFFALRHEQWMIRTYLGREDESVVQPGEIDRLVPAYRRSFRSVMLFGSFQWGKWWRVRTRNHMLVRLAFEKWHMAGELEGDDPMEAHEHAKRVQELREELKNYSVE